MWDHLDQLVQEGKLKQLLHHSSDRGVGKFGFVSHTKHIAEVTNMDLFHS